jgi:hypothetical protein
VNAVRWGAWATLVLVGLVHALAPAEPFPCWGSDPTRFSAAIVGLSPSWSVWMHLAAAAAACVALIAERRVMIVPLGLALIGAAGVSIQALLLRAGTVEDARIGAAWLAAVLGAVAMAHLCRDERLRRMTAAVVLGALLMMVAKGFVQVLVEHPATVARYRQDKAAFIAAQGWSADSPSARAFERRLMQPEATGWFGMANVYASFMAGGVVTLTGLAVMAWRCRLRRQLSEGWAGVVSLGAAACGAGLVLSHSKGGVGAALAGVVALGAMRLGSGWLSRRPAPGGPHGGAPGGYPDLCSAARIGGGLAVGLIGAALAAVVVRGVIGERLGELSLLFRWFYVQGASRTFAASPLVGVGPAGFKDAYMLHKPPLSPEEIVSPHSVMWDYAAMLGAFGLAWCGVFLWLVWRAGAGGCIRAWAGRGGPVRWMVTGPDGVWRATSGEPGEDQWRLEAWLMLLLAAAATVIASRSELAAATPEAAAVRLAGLAAWLGAAVGAYRLFRVESRWVWPLAAGTIAMAVHSQIEVTAVWPGSAMVFYLLLGSVAAPGPSEGPASGRRRIGVGKVLAAAGLGTVLCWLPQGLAMTRWEGRLSAGARAVEPLAEIHGRLDELAAGGPMAGPGGEDSIPQIGAAAARLGGVPVPRNQAEFEEAMRRAFLAVTGPAAGELEGALRAEPRQFQTAEALSRLRVMRAQALAAGGDREGTARELLGALAAAREQAEGGSRRTASAWSLLANTLRSEAELTGRAGALGEASVALERADRLDPYGVVFPWRLYELAVAGGDEGAARHWGRLVLERDQLQRLDREARGLTEDQRRRVRATLGEP